jgi:hypothetical protein
MKGRMESQHDRRSLNFNIKCTRYLNPVGRCRARRACRGTVARAGTNRSDGSAKTTALKLRSGCGEIL